MKLTLNKKDLIYISIIAILSIVIAYPYIKGDKDIKKNNIKIAKSEGRVQILQSDLDSLNSSILLLKAEKDSMILLSDNEPKTRTVTKTVYYEKKINVIAFDLDSNISFCTRWLSEADSIKF